MKIQGIGWEVGFRNQGFQLRGVWEGLKEQGIKPELFVMLEVE